MIQGVEIITAWELKALQVRTNHFLSTPYAISEGSTRRVEQHYREVVSTSLTRIDGQFVLTLVWRPEK